MSIYSDILKPIKEQEEYADSVVIEDGAWIGINVTILQGTHIGKNSVVGAGAIVKGRFPDHCVLVGNPARIVKRFDHQTNRWVKVKN